MIQTQTIDIEHVRKVLQNCPHFDKIVNYEYPYGDTLSKKLIDWYRELIFSANGNNEKQLMLIKILYIFNQTIQCGTELIQSFGFDIFVGF